MGSYQDRVYLEALRIEAGESIQFFSNKMKPDRELSTCVAFLRCIGIDFDSQEILSCKSEPVDVCFREARFQVREVLDEGRRRHDELKAARDRLFAAESLSHLVEPYRPPTPLRYSEVVEILVEVLKEKAARYGRAQCAQLDALVYINLRQRTLDANSVFPSVSDLCSQGWRSVSFVMPMYARVVCAEDSAPDFLRRFMAETRCDCKNPPTLFDY